MKEYRPTERDNLFTAYMDYLKAVDLAGTTTPEPDPQPTTITADQRADLDRAIKAACMEYFKAEKGEK